MRARPRWHFEVYIQYIIGTAPAWMFVNEAVPACIFVYKPPCCSVWFVAVEQTTNLPASPDVCRGLGSTLPRASARSTSCPPVPLVRCGFTPMRLPPLRAQSVTAFAGRCYSTTTIPAAGPSKPGSAQPPPSADEVRRKRRTDWKRRQNVSTLYFEY